MRARWTLLASWALLALAAIPAGCGKELPIDEPPTDGDGGATEGDGVTKCDELSGKGCDLPSACANFDGAAVDKGWELEGKATVAGGRLEATEACAISAPLALPSKTALKNHRVSLTARVRVDSLGDGKATLLWIWSESTAGGIYVAFDGTQLVAGSSDVEMDYPVATIKLATGVDELVTLAIDGVEAQATVTVSKVTTVSITLPNDMLAADSLVGGVGLDGLNGAFKPWSVSYDDVCFGVDP